jgi:small conductance mechanosensitive channel
MWLWVRLFGRPPAPNVALGAVAVALVLAWVCAELLTSLVRRSVVDDGQNGEARRRTARTTTRLVRLFTLVALTIVFIPPVLELFGQPLKAGLRLSTLVDWFFHNGVKIVLIITTAYVLVRVVDAGTARFERQLQGPDAGAQFESAKRARTLGDMARNVATAVIFLLAGVYVLEELGFSPVPFLTGASFAGLAIGFGAQTLVKDVISGFFLILEDQVRIGDVAEINGTSGLVEALRLRTLVLRDARGAMHVFPCGSITTLANLSKGFSYAVVDVLVRNRNDVERVLDVLQRVDQSFRKDAAYGPSILAPIEMLGVERRGDTAAAIRLRLKTVALRQWEVARALRRRLLDELGESVEIPIVEAPPETDTVQPSPPPPAQPSSLA